MVKHLLIGALVGAGLVLLGGMFLPSASNVLAGVGYGMNHYQQENFLQGFTAGITGQYTQDSSGNVSSGGNLVLTGSTHLANVVEGGVAVSITTTSTLTGTQICQGDPITIANATSGITLTLPAATSTNAVARCLSTDGDFLRFIVLNNGTGTVAFATSTGDTIVKVFTGSSTLTLASSSSPYALVTVLRTDSSTNKYFIGNFGANQ